MLLAFLRWSEFQPLAKMNSSTRNQYVELKSAQRTTVLRIQWVTFSRPEGLSTTEADLPADNSGRVNSNHYDVGDREEYWIRA